MAISATISLFTLLLLIAFSGLLLSYGLSRALLSVPTFGHSLCRISRRGSWVLLIMLTPLTDWLYQTADITHTVSSVAIGITGVFLSATAQYQASHRLLDAEGGKIFLRMVLTPLNYGVLAALIIHLRVNQVYWFSLPPGSHISRYGYVAAGILCVVLIVIAYWLTRFRDGVVIENCKIVLNEITDLGKRNNSSAACVSLAIGIPCALWVAVYGQDSLSACIELTLRVKSLALGAPILAVDDSIWRHFGWSLLEVSLGTAIAMCFATLLEMYSRRNHAFELWIVRVISPTYVLTVLLPCFFLGYRQPPANIWFSVQIISLLTFYPIFETFLGFRDARWICCRLLALEKSLGYAFIGMLLGESIHASYGIGLAMSITGATSETITSLAIALFVTTGFMIIARIIRWLVLRECSLR